MDSPNQPYVAGVDHLRAYAALLIVVYHGVQLISAPILYGKEFAFAFWPSTANPLAAVVVEGHTAVALFMVLSGFIFARAALGRTIRYGAFVRNRLLRIYPLFVALFVTGIYALPAGFTATGFLQTLLLGANLPGHIETGHFSTLFWAVSVEFQFYLVFPALMAFFARYGWRWLAGALAVCLLLRVGAILEGAVARDMSYATIVGRMDQFLIGMALARAMHDQAAWWRRPWILPAGLAITIAGLAVFHRLGGWPVESPWKITWPPIEGALWALTIGGYLAIADRLPAAVSKGLAGIGTISYSIYLLHFLVLHQLIAHRVIWQPTGRAYIDAFITTMAVALPLILGLSSLTYAVIERPFLSLRRQYLA